MKFETVGLDDFASDLRTLAMEADDVAEEMLNAAAPVLEKAWRDEIERRGFVKTQSMTKNVKSTISLKKKTIETYPRGKGKKSKSGKEGTPNAVKAFVLHHGRKSNPKTGRDAIRATYFVNDISENGGIAAQVEMRDVLDQKLKEKGL